MKLSCIALTEPFDAAVVAVAQSAEFAMPKRDLLAFHVAAGLQRARGLVDAERCEDGIARLLGARRTRTSSGTKITSIAAKQRPALAPVLDHARRT